MATSRPSSAMVTASRPRKAEAATWAGAMVEYPVMSDTADAVLVDKIDLLPHLRFDDLLRAGNLPPPTAPAET